MRNFFLCDNDILFIAFDASIEVDDFFIDGGHRICNISRQKSVGWGIQLFFAQAGDLVFKFFNGACDAVPETFSAGRRWVPR